MVSNPQSVKPYKEIPVSIQLVRSELNLQKWIGLFATGQFKGKSRRIVRSTRNGELEVTVGLQFDERGNEVEVGVLRVPSYKVLEALIFTWEMQGKPEGWIYSSRRAVASVLGKKWGGKQAQQLKNNLRALAEIPLRWKRFYFQKYDYVVVDEPHPLRFVKLHFLTKQRAGKDVDWRFKFQFDERFEQNLRSGYTKPVRLDVISRLSDISTLMFSHVDLIMADKTAYTRRSANLFTDLGLMSSARYKYPAKRKLEIEKALKELISNPKAEGYSGTPMSTGTLTNMKLSKTKDGKDWNVLFTKRPNQKQSIRKSRERQIELVGLMKDELGQFEKNKGFYIQIARKCPDNIIRTAIADTKAEERERKLKQTRAQFFGYWIQILADSHGVDLGLKSSFKHLTHTH